LQDSLPVTSCPINWAGALCNRAFKVKLIKGIVEKLHGLLEFTSPTGKQR